MFLRHWRFFLTGSRTCEKKNFLCACAPASLNSMTIMGAHVRNFFFSLPRLVPVPVAEWRRRPWRRSPRHVATQPLSAAWTIQTPSGGPEGFLRNPGKPTGPNPPSRSPIPKGADMTNAPPIPTPPPPASDFDQLPVPVLLVVRNRLTRTLTEIETVIRIRAATI